MNNKMMFFIFLFQAFVFNLSNVIIPKYLDMIHVDKFLFGYFIAFWFFGMMCSSPFWGAISNKIGSKKLVIFGIVIYGASQFAFYFTSHIVVLFLLRITSGIGAGAIVTLLLAQLVQCQPACNTSKALSMRMAFLTGGNLIAYKVSGYLCQIYDDELFLLQGILSSVLLLLVMLFVRENKLCCRTHVTIFNSVFHVTKISKNVVLFLVSIMLTTITFVTVDKFIDLFLIDEGYSVMVVGNVKMVYGIVFILGSLFIVPRVKSLLSNLYVLQSILVLMSLVILIVFMQRNYILMLSSVFVLFMALKSIYVTSEQLFCSRLVEKEEVAVVMGLRQSFASMGMILGPIIGGHIYQDYPINVFIFAVICLLLSSVILSYITESNAKETSLNFEQ